MIASLRKPIALGLIAVVTGSFCHLPSANAQILPWMPKPGVRISLSVPYIPAHLNGLTIHTDDPFRYDFLIHQGDMPQEKEAQQAEYQKLIKYFLASLTIPDENQWVNLSPYEKNRIIEQDFSQTEMGRDLLAQDYVLKQITASLMYPEEKLGQKFWDKVYSRAQEELGTTEVPMNTFNKVWIVPDKATVYEKGNTVYVLENTLKVMMEEDYLSLEKNSAKRFLNTELIANQKVNQASSLSSRVVREIIIPELQKEVNEGKNFAVLRQIYSGMILSTWYKKALKESLLTKIYADKSKIKGVNNDDPRVNEKIYQQYLAAYKKGVFNYIKEDIDKITKQPIPRKYFSGGALNHFNQAMTTLTNPEQVRAWRQQSSGATEVPGFATKTVSVEARLQSSQPTANAAMTIVVDVPKIDSSRNTAEFSRLYNRYGGLDRYIEPYLTRRVFTINAEFIRKINPRWDKDPLEYRDYLGMVLRPSGPNADNYRIDIIGNQLSDKENWSITIKLVERPEKNIFFGRLIRFTDAERSDYFHGELSLSSQNMIISKNMGVVDSQGIVSLNLDSIESYLLSPNPYIHFEESAASQLRIWRTILEIVNARELNVDQLKYLADDMLSNIFEGIPRPSTVSPKDATPVKLMLSAFYKEGILGRGNMKDHLGLLAVLYSFIYRYENALMPQRSEVNAAMTTQSIERMRVLNENDFFRELFGPIDGERERQARELFLRGEVPLTPTNAVLTERIGGFDTNGHLRVNYTDGFNSIINYRNPYRNQQDEDIPSLQEFFKKINEAKLTVSEVKEVAKVLLDTAVNINVGDPIILKMRDSFNRLNVSSKVVQFLEEMYEYKSLDYTFNSIFRKGTILAVLYSIIFNYENRVGVTPQQQKALEQNEFFRYVLSYPEFSYDSPLNPDVPINGENAFFPPEMARIDSSNRVDIDVPMFTAAIFDPNPYHPSSRQGREEDTRFASTLAFIHRINQIGLTVNEIRSLANIMFRLMRTLKSADAVEEKVSAEVTRENVVNVELKRLIQAMYHYRNRSSFMNNTFLMAALNSIVLYHDNPTLQKISWRNMWDRFSSFVGIKVVLRRAIDRAQMHVRIAQRGLTFSLPATEVERDQPMLQEEAVGGIDLNAANLNLIIKRDGKGVPLPFSQQDIVLLEKIEGLNPVIIAINPARDLSILNDLK